MRNNDVSPHDIYILYIICFYKINVFSFLFKSNQLHWSYAKILAVVSHVSARGLHNRIPLSNPFDPPIPTPRSRTVDATTRWQRRRWWRRLRRIYILAIVAYLLLVSLCHLLISSLSHSRFVLESVFAYANINRSVILVSFEFPIPTCAILLLEFFLKV